MPSRTPTPHIRHKGSNVRAPRTGIDLRIDGDTHVNAAFTYTRTGGNRFNSEGRGARYGAWEVMVHSGNLEHVRFNPVHILQP